LKNEERRMSRLIDADKLEKEMRGDS